jgi:hypothetical protein
MAFFRLLFCFVLRPLSFSVLFIQHSHNFFCHLQGNRGERQRLRRIMDRKILKDSRFHNKRVGRTPSGVDVDAEIMQSNVPINTPADRTFLAFCCPMPCQACRRLRCGSQMQNSCECTFFAIRGSTASRFDPLKRPTCPVCRTERYRDGIFQLCLCISRCREYCIAEGLWR